jgi:hypothetical protein
VDKTVHTKRRGIQTLLLNRRNTEVSFDRFFAYKFRRLAR